MVAAVEAHGSFWVPARMRGLTFLVTGATGGLGSLVCKDLVARGAHVIAHGRSRAKLDALLADLGSGARGVLADFASLAETHALARDIGQFDVLVNNAGVGFGRDQMKRETSREGFELRFAVNYIAPFILTYSLIGRVQAVIQVASAGQRALDFTDLDFEHNYDGIVAYRRSKLAQVMLMLDTAASCAVPTNALHPGTFLDTGMVRESGITPLGTAREGADAIGFVIERTLEGVTGRFFDQHRIADADPAAYDTVARAKLREWTTEQVLARLRDARKRDGS
jgi:NAD(P)-dependent dehydrogenase (short-subunit alcohol dehydrogenase family)